MSSKQLARINEIHKEATKAHQAAKKAQKAKNVAQQDKQHVDKLKSQIQKINAEMINVRKAQQVAVAQQRITKQVNLPAEQIIAGILDPKNHPVVRYSSAFTQQNTEVCKPWKRYDVPWTVHAESERFPENAIAKMQKIRRDMARGLRDSNLPEGVMMAFAFRNLLRSLVTWDPNIGNEAYSYRALGCQTNSDILPATTWTISDASALNVFQPLSVSYYEKLSTYTPHGPEVYCGNDGESENTYVWCESGTVFSVQLQTTGSYNVNLALDRWTPQGVQNCVAESDTEVITSTPNTITVTTTSAGYFALRWKYANAMLNEKQQRLTPEPKKVGDAAPVVFSVVSVTFGKSSGGVWCHKHAPYYHAAIELQHTTRVQSVSLMYTNEAAMLNLQGKITMSQLPAGDDWYSYALNPLALESTQGSETMPAKKGMYGYLKATQPSDTDLQCYVTVNDEPKLIKTSYPLNEKSGFLGMSIFIAEDAGRQGYFTHVVGYEFVATTTLYEGVKPTTDPVVFLEAQNRIKDIDQFNENPSHVRRFFAEARRVAKSIVGYVKDYGPVVMEGARMLGAVL